MSWNSLLADLILYLHFAYVAFVLVGFVLILLGIVLRWGWVRNFWFRVAHFGCIAIVAFEAVFGWTCPLTTWEHDLRYEDGTTSTDDERSFMSHWIDDLLFYEVEEDELAKYYYAFGGLVLLTLILAPPRRPGRRDPDPGETVAT